MPTGYPIPRVRKRGRDVLYVGTRHHRAGQFHVAVRRGGPIGPLPPRHDLVNHSPSGFAWGYGGPSPAQLAIALLAHYLQDENEALRLHQRFKEAVVASMDQESDWTLNTNDMERGLAAARAR